MTTEPVRLLEQLDLPEDERSLLKAGRAAPPVDYDVAEGEARFRRNLTALAAAGVVAGAAAGQGMRAGGRVLLGKLAVKVVIGLTLAATFSGAGIVVGMRIAKQQARVEAAPPPPRPHAIAPAPPRASSAPSETAAAPAPEAASAPQASAPRASAPHAPEARRPRSRPAPATSAPPEPPAVQAAALAVTSAPPPSATTAAPEPPPSATATAETPAPMSELRAVALARGLVDQDPDAALDLLAKAQRAYPAGYFLEERRALTVLALARAGRASDAKQAAASFLRAYPNGPYSDRVREVAKAPSP